MSSVFPSSHIAIELTRKKLGGAHLNAHLNVSVSQSAARIQMMSHLMSKPCETVPCSSDFHDAPIAPVSFHSHCSLYIFQKFY